MPPSPGSRTGTKIRYYNAKTRQWPGRNLYVGGDLKRTVAEWKDPEMIVTILDADSFQMKSARSYDDGKTWVKGAYFMQVVRSKW